MALRWCAGLLVCGGVCAGPAARGAPLWAGARAPGAGPGALKSTAASAAAAARAAAAAAARAGGGGGAEPGAGMLHALYPEGSSAASKTSLPFTPAACAALQVSMAVRYLCGRASDHDRELLIGSLKDLSFESVILG